MSAGIAVQAVALTVTAAIGLVLLLPMVSDFVSLLRTPSRESSPIPGGPPSRFIFLVPAHNEARLITSCVESLLNLRYPTECRRVIVLADNCSDDTAARAQAAGAEVLERSDTARPGKPHALAWALPQLPLDRYDALVIVDADAVLDPGFAGAMAAHAPLRDKVVQPYDDVRNPAASAITRMAALLAAGRFRAAFPLKAAAGLNVPLSDGMCVGTGILRSLGWQAFGLSEDCEMYARLTAEGVRIELEHGAHLYAEEAGALRHASTQRKRWTAGRWQALARVGPALASSRRIGWHQKIDVVAELITPGPGLQSAWVAACAGLLWAGHPPGALALATLLGLSLARPVAFALAGLAHVAEPLATARSFLFFPAYAAWRVVVLLGTPRVLIRDSWIATRHGS